MIYNYIFGSVVNDIMLCISMKAIENAEDF